MNPFVNYVVHATYSSTSGMAEDTITLLEYVGWTGDIHVVGMSMGGMVAQGESSYEIMFGGEIELNLLRSLCFRTGHPSR